MDGPGGDGARTVPVPAPMRRSIARLALVAVALAVALALPRVVTPFWTSEQSLVDWRYALFGGRTPPRADITLILVDEPTLDRLPYRSPIDRGFIAGLLDRLAAAGVRAVVLDILFDRPTEPGKDALLAERMRNFPAPLIAAYGDPGSAMTDRQFAQLRTFLSGMPRGYANLRIDPRDGTVRYMNLRPRDGTGPQSLVAETARLIGLDLPAGDPEIAYALGPAPNVSPFPAFAAWQVELLPPAFFRDRIVLIGGNYAAEDRYRTPLSAAYGEQLGRLPGVTIHAHMLAQLIDRRQAPGFGPGPEAAAALLAAALGLAVAAVDIALVWKSLLLVVAFLAGLASLAGAYVIGGPMLPVLAPAVAFALAAGGELARAQRAVSRERAFIKGALGRYVPEDVVRMLEREPHRLKLGGERRELSLLFTDIADFTSLAEELPAERLVQLLNEYLDGVSQIVLAHGGAIDKFVGDAVVAIFGAFRDNEDHAGAALDCALAIDGFAEGFRERAVAGGLAFGLTRIGINTGQAVIGNFGGAARFDFTATGDAVNAAARLESANKAFGTRILVADTTVRSARTPPPHRPVGALQVKGKNLSMLVHEPLSAHHPGLARLDAYLAAYALVERRDAAAALAAFRTLAAAAPDDPLVAFHLGRLEGGTCDVGIRLKDK